MSNRVVHFEIPCDNPQKTMDFFQEVFGWKFEQFGKEEYWSVITGDNEEPGINGGVMKKRDPNQPLVNSIDVSNLDEYLEKIKNAGAPIVVPKTAIPGIGWMAYFKDPDGNIHGVYQKDSSASM